jgi:hypothetical protein
MGWNASFAVWIETYFDHYKRGHHCPLVDPNRAQRTKAKNIKAYPNHYRTNLKG